MLFRSTNGDVAADYEDISLLPGQDPCYALSPQLTNSTAIKALADSDLNAILARLSEQAAHRFKHVAKNNTKTNLKIKNH